MKPGDTFLLVGLGLMGGSYAGALKQAGYHVLAADANPEALEYALAAGMIDEGCTDPTALLPQAAYIVLALYPQDILPWLQQYAGAIAPGAVVTDLTGVKNCYLEAAQALLPNNEYISCHPMAGREKSGVQNADATMFHGANFIIVPTARNTPDGIRSAGLLAGTLGVGNVTILSAEKHDEMIAYVSQLTHAIAVSLMNANDNPQLPAVTGDSFRDLTRIANINDGLWSQLFLANAPALLEQIDLFSASLATLRKALAKGDGEALRAQMRSSTQRRQSFERDKNGTP